MLPADDVSYGFDNIAGVQRMSPTLMERYLAAAQKISAVAVGASTRAPTTETFLVPPELRQDDRLEGLPFGTRGGTVMRHTFPRDGEYSVRVQLTRYAGASFDEIPAFDQTQRLELSIDGSPDARLRAALRRSRRGRGSGPRTEPPHARCRLARPVPGEGRAADRGPDLPQPDARAAREPAGAVRRSRFQAARTATTRHRRAPTSAASRSAVPYERDRAGRHAEPPRIFVCRPSKASRQKRAARGRFFRRSPGARSGVRSTMPTSQTLLAFYQEGRAEGRFRARHRAGGRRSAGQPGVPVPGRARAGRPRCPARRPNYRISDLELASRLSFFLWSSIPDDALLDAAASGTLRNPARARRSTSAACSPTLAPTRS